MKILKNVLVLIAISLFSINSFAQTNSGVAGEWIVGEQNTIVKIEQHDDTYSGKTISSDNSNAEIGKLMVKELKKNKGEWQGKVYAPQRKEWYDAEFVPNGNTLDVKIKVGFFSKTIEWKRK
ncbi:uncharacterized protein DUF2147 [Ulvibacter sp. MAR_2010_11]|uniref:DUF2147 domain-containing protein n=1 Tax=Ulvibacter sp. MAR_2010_11 TaxID=1250229 RepID=UPI000C2CC960|nr:DUF2147 domain-containing protein [Ulvibacter sp. MAR_2010_11]PKA84181.1 uncharacterized protein DUF2147 [Ulvibacter sp. MAR_2010_11]